MKIDFNRQTYVVVYAIPGELAVRIGKALGQGVSFVFIDAEQTLQWSASNLSRADQLLLKPALADYVATFENADEVVRANDWRVLPAYAEHQRAATVAMLLALSPSAAV